MGELKMPFSHCALYACYLLLLFQKWMNKSTAKKIEQIERFFLFSEEREWPTKIKSVMPSYETCCLAFSFDSIFAKRNLPNKKRRGLPRKLLDVWSNIIINVRINESVCLGIYKSLQKLSLIEVPDIKEVFSDYIPETKITTEKYNSEVYAIAKTIKINRSYEDMPILADALEESRADSAIMTHCRQPNHYPGCWLIEKLQS
jgi:hypothetical protein